MGEYELNDQVIKERKSILEIRGEVRDRGGQVSVAARGKYLIFSGEKNRETSLMVDFIGCSQDVWERYLKNP